MAFRRILVTGSRGMLGQELIPYLTAKGFTVTGTNSEQLNMLETIERITEKIKFHEPEIIINTAAYTNVDGAESDPDIAMAVNKDGTQKLALAAKEVGAILAQVSTDYVFDGLKREPYTTQDRPNPISTYGLSKYYGELMVTELMEEYYVIRTSWLYGIHGKNFVQFVLDSARQGREVSITNDQIGSPTWTGSLCHHIEHIITSGRFGTYHASDRGAVSRYDQAQAICKAAGLSTEHIRSVSSDTLNQPANRPDFSALDAGDLPVPSWETSLQAFISQYLDTQKNT